MYFPYICVDNFFTDPDGIVEFAKQFEYFKAPGEITDNPNNLPTGFWPGRRTKPLQYIAPHFEAKFFEKLFSLFYEVRSIELKYRAVSCFQIIDPHEYGIADTGYIHSDETVYTGVVYLSKNMASNSGTSIYKATTPDMPFPKYSEIRDNQHNGLISYNKLNPEHCKLAVEEQNSWYIETIRFNNQYNRLIGFDGDQYHGVPKLNGTETEPRLTLVFFVESVTSSWFPLPNSRKFPL